MAALLLPLAFAGAGYLGFGSTGAAIGWLIGAWLFGPKADNDNQIFDPGAQEMPRFNQSLRGVTIPVLFGTNRVASNVVWTNNFQTIRKETDASPQGGGKGGGSGMGGKGGGGGSTQVSYEYKWDMLFHIGMGPEPYGLFGAWVNNQRMSGETVLAIISGTAGMAPINEEDPGQNNLAQSNNTAALTFDDSFFGAGGGTEDTSFDNWNWFEHEVGFPCRWPHTYYIGLKALSLGSTPGVPQLSWEVGPGEAEINRVQDFLNSNPENGFDQGTNCIMRGEDGKHYHQITVDLHGHIDLWCLEDDSLIHVDRSTLPAAPGAASASSAHVLPAGNSPYLLHLGWGFPGGADITIHARLYKIDSNGDLVMIKEWGFVQPGGQSGAIDLAHQVGFAFLSYDAIMSQESGYLTWVMQYSLSGTQKVLLVSVEYQGSLAIEDTEALYPVPATALISPVEDGLYIYEIDVDGIGNTPTGMRYDHHQRAFFVPEYHPENSPAPLTGNGKWPISYKLCYYISKAMIAADDGTSDIVADNKGDFPDGFIVGWNILGKADQSIEVTGPSILNSRFSDANQYRLDEFFEDSGKDKDGDADQNSDYVAATIAVTTQGAVALVFAKIFDGADDQNPAGSYLKLKVFVWNPVSMRADLYSESEGAWFDRDDDLGDPGTSRVTPASVIASYDPINRNIYVVGNYHPAEGITPATVAAIWGPMNIGGGKDVLPAYIVYTLLTSPIFGMGFTEDEIDQNSYQLALQYCDGQDFKVSTQYTREDDILSVIEDLLSLYGGFLTYSGGKVKFGIQKFTTSPVRTIDNHHLIPPKPGDPPVVVTKGARQDGFNKVRVNYFDRKLDYRQNQFEVGDEVDQDFNGVRFKEFPPKYVMDRGMASTVAERALWTNLYARDTFAFRLGWKDGDLEPGDVVTLVDSFHPELQQGVNVRIARWKEMEKGKFDVQAVLEVEYYMSAVRSVDTSVNSNGPTGQNDPLLPVRDFRMYELPREFQGAAARLYVGYNQQSRIKGATLWVSPDGISYSPATNAEPYMISGQFAQPLPAASPGDVERDVEFYLLTASGFTVDTPTYCQTLALDDISAGVRAAGGGTMICGSEALAMQGLTLLGQNRYRIAKLYRGWGGTLPQPHSSGDLWHKHAGGALYQEITTDKIGTVIYYKVVPYNFANQAYDVSSVDGKSYTIRGGYFVPQILPGLKTFVESGISGTASEDLRGNVFRQVTSGGCDVTFDWADSSRENGYGAGGYGAGAYGRFSSDVDIHSWRVEVMSGGVVVRSTSVASGPFTYTREQNSADFAGFGSAFQVRVTPYNVYGDAPVSEVKSLNLFW